LTDPILDAITAANAGMLIALPTDTVYGIGTRADRADGIDRLFQAKGREHGAPLPVFVGSIEVARRLAVFDERADRLARSFWPGGLTIVLNRAGDSLEWDLGGDGATIGLRIPGHRLAREVAGGVTALAVTSANRSGAPVLTTCDELAEAFVGSVEVILCEEKPLEGSASTVVDISGDGMRVLREGAISQTDLERALV
jgi:tRNA threonylcarbamoyl adenosine modification protein (Sua5/YciO/YrdC/YwlC family)